MARWRLAAPHYLNVPGTLWEYREIDRNTGKPARKTYEVPTLLDPFQPGDWTHKYNQDEGDIIVCLEGKGEPKDLTFVGEPTPDMIPMDDEAKAISAKFAGKWKHPIDSLPGAYSETILDNLQKEVAEVRAKSAAAPPEAMTELLTAMAAMMKQNQELIAALAKPAEGAARRI